MGPKSNFLLMNENSNFVVESSGSKYVEIFVIGTGGSKK